MQRAQGFAEQGAQVVWTAGVASTTLVQASAPYATIRVYLTGTTTLATLYSDNQPTPTPMANPFTANEYGYWFFYAPDGRYDVMIVAEDWTWTIGDLFLGDLYSWSKDVQANGHSLWGLGTLQANSVIASTGQFGSLQANSITSPAYHVTGCITWENAAGWMSICIDTAARLLISNPSQTVMTIDQQGHVGVGVGLAAAQSQLEVGGTIRVTGESDIPASGSGLELVYQASPAPLGIVQAYDRTAHAWLPVVIDASLLQLNSNTGGNVTMCLQGGNVGIRIPSPQAVFEAKGTIRITDDLPVPGPGQGLELGYQTSPAALGIVQAYDRTASQWLPIVIDGSLTSLNANTGGNVTMCLQGGNVGIRTPGPLAVFEAAGTIRIIDDLPVPGPGAGLELGYQPSPPLGIMQAFDRTANQWVAIIVDGNPVEINTNTGGNVIICRGGGNVSIGPGGGWKLHVEGDINCAGQFRQNGVPVALGLTAQAAQDALEARVAALEAKVK